MWAAMQVSRRRGRHSAAPTREKYPQTGRGETLKVIRAVRGGGPPQALAVGPGDAMILAERREEKISGGGTSPSLLERDELYVMDWDFLWFVFCAVRDLDRPAFFSDFALLATSISRPHAVLRSPPPVLIL